MVAISSLIERWAAAAYIGSHGFWDSGLGGCNVSADAITLPHNQTALVAPTNLTASFVGVAFGVQNYTCSATSNYTSIGAVAELFDISCLQGTELFNTIQEPLFQAWANATSNITVQELIATIPAFVPADLILAQHFFIPNPAGAGLSPVWDFRATQRFHGVADALFVGKGVGALPDPVNPAVDITWLQVGRVSGSIADEVFRIDTVGGQPPTSCTFGTSPNISVRYTSQYWFFGGSLSQYDNEHGHKR